ncbi:MAG: TonB-dependent receptor [Proteobacteria bacterium]|nr:TonB-dependent receptor [Pseudomonadota bacterium]
MVPVDQRHNIDRIACLRDAALAGRSAMRCLLVVLFVAVALVLPVLASAAETDAAGTDALEEVLVTAQKRSENVQSVPLSITTFGAAALEQKAITNIFDYATKVPNLAFAPTGDGVSTARTISIRGIAGDNVTGFYIDDVPLPDSLDPRVLDVDHIEVLRGPQGTLYGARSMGGTVRIITRAANLNDFEGTVHAGASSTDRTVHGNWSGDGVVNLPLIPEHVALRLSGFYDSEAGYFKRSFCTDPATAGIACTPLSGTGITTLRNIAAVASYGGAASLTLKFDDLTITPRFMRQRTVYNGFPTAPLYSDPNNGYGYPVPSGPYQLPTPLLPRDFTQAHLFNVPEGGHDSWDLASLTLKWRPSYGELVSSTAYFSREVFETEDQGDLIWAAITSAIPGATPGPGPVSELKDYQRFVQEVRFASDFAGPVQLVAGGFYSDLHGRLPYSAYFPPSTIPGLDAATGGPNNPDYANLVFAQDFHTTIREPAIFGEVAYTPIDPLKITLGLRWYQVKISSYGYEEGLVVGGGPALISPFATTKESGTNPKIAVDYHLTPDHMLYAVASKGFRPGGLVPAVPAGAPNTATDCVAALAQQNPGVSLANTRSYKSDSLWNYELGTKTSWLNHKLTLNAAGFYVRWKDIQQAVLLSCGFQFITNAGAATSKGGELELSVRVLDGLDFSLGLGYQDAKISAASAASPQPAGSPVFQVPDWTANSSLAYRWPLPGGHWRLLSTLDYSYVGRSFSGNNNAAEPRERLPYQLVNLRLAAEHGPLELAVVAKNLTNEAANLGDSRSIAAEIPGRPRLFVNQPRTVGIEVRRQFD